jgi:hypothetical protein
MLIFTAPIRPARNDFTIKHTLNHALEFLKKT